jgi:hypothetical protein
MKRGPTPFHFLSDDAAGAGGDAVSDDEDFDSLVLDAPSLFSLFVAEDPDWFFFA